MDDIKIDITLHTAYHKMTFISGKVEGFTLKIMILIADFKIGSRVKRHSNNYFILVYFLEYDFYF